MSFCHIVVEYILPLELNEMKTSLHMKVVCWVWEMVAIMRYCIKL